MVQDREVEPEDFFGRRAGRPFCFSHGATLSLFVIFMNERFPLAYLVPAAAAVRRHPGAGRMEQARGGWLHGTPLLRNLDRWLADDKPYGFFMPVVNVAHAHPEDLRLLDRDRRAGDRAVAAGRTGDARQLGAGRADVAVVRGGNGQGLAPPGNALLMARCSSCSSSRRPDACWDSTPCSAIACRAGWFSVAASREPV